MDDHNDAIFENPDDAERLLLKKLPPEMLQPSESGLAQDLWLEQVRTAGDQGEEEEDARMGASLTERALTAAIEDERQRCWEEFADADPDEDDEPVL